MQRDSIHSRPSGRSTTWCSLKHESRKQTPPRYRQDSPGRGRWSHYVPISIGACSATAMTVYIFARAPMEAVGP
jgi:hypothetical protein